MTNQERASLFQFYTRAYLPLAMISVGLIFAFIGAAGVAWGNPYWVYVVVGGLFAILGCAMQVAAWQQAVVPMPVPEGQKSTVRAAVASQGGEAPRAAPATW
jgi:hypothetical protein